MMYKIPELLKVDVVCDGQFGSTGKGLLSQWAYMHETYDWHITNAGAQSGHTSYHVDGYKIVAFHLSTAGIHQKLNGGNGYQYLSAGCIIDRKVLLKEIEEFGYDETNLIIHPHAVVITTTDKLEETKNGSSKVAGTGKGVGSSLSNKINREAPTARDYAQLRKYTKKLVNCETAPLKFVSDLWGKNAILEIPQGYSLGINSGFYPYTTSRECSLMQGMADVQLNPASLRTVMMCVRANPIRVGNTADGFSGGWYSDQHEMDWEDFGVEPETTTVTGRIRRIASFSSIQYANALLVNKPDVVLINFMNYLNEMEREKVATEIFNTEKKVGVYPRHRWGFGPNVENIRKDWI